MNVKNTILGALIAAEKAAWSAQPTPEQQAKLDRIADAYAAVSRFPASAFEPVKETP